MVSRFLFLKVHSIVLDIIDCAVRDATAVIWSEAIDLDTQEYCPVILYCYSMLIG